ncbi:calicin-like [Tigriopus californicus]|uniref:calicin-like n=1 Tax=Tigriopus californicus TaxID=6832 RepID=UPI0027DA72D6|nr:calicin-like [Tigriopus californicus]
MTSRKCNYFAFNVKGFWVTPFKPNCDDNDNHSSTLVFSAVEVIGKQNNTCVIPPLPEPRIGLTVSRLKKSVIACGGFFHHDRSACYQYFPVLRRWVHTTNLPTSTSYLASVGEGYYLYVVGGRFWDHQSSELNYLNATWQYNAITRIWNPLHDLETPTADGCLLALHGDLIFVGGSIGRYRYESEPSNVWVLRKGASSWEKNLVKPLLAPRMWQSCLITNYASQIGIMVVGGYYNGISAMFLPLTEFHQAKRGALSTDWQWVGSLPEDRKWGPALGLVNGILTVAGGQDYGDNTIDELSEENSFWRRSTGKTLKWKREFSSHVTVPSWWFPACGLDF